MLNPSIDLNGFLVTPCLTGLFQEKLKMIQRILLNLMSGKRFILIVRKEVESLYSGRPA